MATTLERFGEHGTEPDSDTLERAAALELGLASGWPLRRGMTEANARGLLEEVYRGELVGRLEAGRAVLRAPCGPVEAG